SLRAEKGEWQSGDIILDLYEVKKELGVGGFGKVYLLYHRGWQMDLAVKTPSNSTLEAAGGALNFEREAETWVNLGLHPHTVSCYYVRRVDNIPRVFAEYVAGGDLNQWIRQQLLYRGGTDRALARIIDIAIQFAWGLHYAHDQGLIHQDVKPANVIMTEGGTAKVTDFGLARAKALKVGGTRGETMVVDGVGLTPQYASPEQVTRQKLTRRTDIWSWAVSILEMFVGERTWESGTIAGYQLEAALETGPTQPYLPRIPPAIGELLGRCFREDPDQRPRTMDEVAEWLRTIYPEVTGAPYPRGTPVAGRDTADSLNNRAISLFDLGQCDEALKTWEHALKVQPHQLETTYNRGLILWRSGKVADDALVKEVGESGTNSGRRGDLLARLHMERGDCTNAITLLENNPLLASGDEGTAKLLTQAKNGLSRSRRSLGVFEHAWGICAVALDKNCRLALTGSEDGLLSLWDSIQGKCLRTIKGHQGQIYTVSFTPDGQHIISGGKDGLIKTWLLESGQCEYTFRGHLGSVRSLSMGLSGDLIVSGGEDHTLKLWKPPQEYCLLSMDGHRGTITAVCFDLEGRYALSGSDDGTLKQWNLETGQSTRTFKGHTGGVTSISLNGDGSNGLSGSQDESLRLWDLRSGECLRQFPAKQGAVNTVALSRDGRYALSGGQDGNIRLWEVERGVCLRTFAGHGGSLMDLCMSPDGLYAVSGSRDKTARLWNLKKKYEYAAPFILSQVRSSEKSIQLQTIYDGELATAKGALDKGNHKKALTHLRKARAQPGFERGKEAMILWRRLYQYLPHRWLHDAWRLFSLPGHDSAVRTVCLNRNSSYALSGGDDGLIKLWATEKGNCIRVLRGHLGPVTSLCFSNGGNFAFSGSEDHTVKFWDLDKSNCIQTFKGHTAGVTCVSLSSDQRLAVSGGTDQTLRLWETGTGRCLRVFQGHPQPVNSACFTQDSSHIISASGDQTIKIWEVESGKCSNSFGTFGGHTGAVNSLCASYDGRNFLSGGDDGTCRLWDLRRNFCLKTFSGHKEGVSSVSMSFDGSFALSAGRDGVVKLWEVANGECLHTLKGPGPRLNAVSLGYDRGLGVAGCEDGNIIFWILDWGLEEAVRNQEWYEEARPYLEVFLRQHMSPHGNLPIGVEVTEQEITNTLRRQGAPRWTKKDLEELRQRLNYAGYVGIGPTRLRAEIGKTMGRIKNGSYLQEGEPLEPMEDSSTPPTGSADNIVYTAVDTLADKARHLSIKVALAAGVVIGAILIYQLFYADHFEEQSALAAANEYLLQGDDINAVMADRRTRLHVAAEEGQTSVVALLVENGAGLHLRDGRGWTPMHAAAHGGHREVVALLISKGARTGIQAGRGLVTPLWLADTQGHQETVELLQRSRIANSRPEP
ncbi:MAG: protein kinase, partial [Gammaproteobacteria bacterium]|nr:protein kinase [Gammaproteobacteria bacterium]